MAAGPARRPVTRQLVINPVRCPKSANRQRTYGERATVSSCARGHPVSPGAEYCASCGEDVRPRCYQGHRSAAGSRFCDTCGVLLDPAASDVPATGLVTEYTSGSLLEILAEDAGDPARSGPPAPDRRAATPFAARQATTAPAEARDDDDPSTLTDFEAVDAGYGGRGRGGKRRPRVPLAAAVVAVLVVAGVAGFMLLHHRSAQPASAGPSPGAAVTASASPTSSRSLAPAARPGGRPDRQPGHHRGLLPGAHHVLRRGQCRHHHVLHRHG